MGKAEQAMADSGAPAGKYPHVPTMGLILHDLTDAYALTRTQEAMSKKHPFHNFIDLQRLREFYPCIRTSLKAADTLKAEADAALRKKGMKPLGSRFHKVQTNPSSTTSRVSTILLSIDLE